MDRYVRDHFGIGDDGKTHVRLIHDSGTDDLIAAEFGDETDMWSFRLDADAVDELVAVWRAATRGNHPGDAAWREEMTALDLKNRARSEQKIAGTKRDRARSSQKIASDEQADHCRDHHEWEGVGSCPQCEVEAERD